MRLSEGGLDAADVIALLQFHLDEAHQHSPPGAVHALDLGALKTPDVQFWTMRDNAGALMGFGALKTLDASHGEVKSMRTAPGFLRRGVGRALLTHIIDTARQAGLKRLSLETGKTGDFAAAVALYRAFGFEVCPPFGTYRDDGFSQCMTLGL